VSRTDTDSLQGRIALITGASSGIGRATALHFASRGATVVAVARRAPLLESLIAECLDDAPDSCHIAGDLGERAFAEGVVEETVARHGRIDVLVNNAGVPLHKRLYEISVEEAERVMRINFHSCLWTSFAAIPHMLKQGGGTLVNVSSFASIVVPTHETIYAASKGAMNGFTRGLWNDLAGSGIHAALVHPGPIETEIWEKLEEPGAYAGKRYPAELVAKAIEKAVVKRRHEVIVPGRDPGLVIARWLRFLMPGLLRRGVARQDPIPLSVVEHARQRALEGKKLGE
jgi:NAD(P)-dependent dehydrogenase (short-subunit alcohol dehydrogenase family)